jgi:hypothetical protein
LSLSRLYNLLDLSNLLYLLIQWYPLYLLYLYNLSLRLNQLRQ